MIIRPLLLSTILFASTLPLGAHAFTSTALFEGKPLTLDIPISATDTCGVVIDQVAPATKTDKVALSVRAINKGEIVKVTMRVMFGNDMFSDEVSGTGITVGQKQTLTGSKFYEDSRHPLTGLYIRVGISQCSKEVSK
jgi:hypothetical protein